MPEEEEMGRIGDGRWEMGETTMGKYFGLTTHFSNISL